MSKRLIFINFKKKKKGSYSVHFGNIRSVLSTLALFSPPQSIQFISALFGPVCPLWSKLVYFGPNRSILSNLALLGPMKSSSVLLSPFFPLWSYSVLFDTLMFSSVHFAPIRSISVLVGPLCLL